MSHEHQPEHRNGGERSHAELETAAHRQLEHLRRHEHREHQAEHPDRRAEVAREAIKQAEKQPEPAAHPAAEREAAPPAPASRLLNPHLNYVHTMTSVQRRLKPVSRSFSRFIHTPAVDRVSEGLERSVARPSAAAGATWTALIVGGVFYFTARRYGYALSGSEMVLSFVVGAVLGLFLELLWRTFFRRRR